MMSFYCPYSIFHSQSYLHLIQLNFSTEYIHENKRIIHISRNHLQQILCFPVQTPVLTMMMTSPVINLSFLLPSSTLTTSSLSTLLLWSAVVMVSAPPPHQDTRVSTQLQTTQTTQWRAKHSTPVKYQSSQQHDTVTLS